MYTSRTKKLQPMIEAGKALIHRPVYTHHGRRNQELETESVDQRMSAVRDSRRQSSTMTSRTRRTTTSMNKATMIWIDEQSDEESRISKPNEALNPSLRIRHQNQPSFVVGLPPQPLPPLQRLPPPSSLPSQGRPLPLHLPAAAAFPLQPPTLPQTSTLAQPIFDIMMLSSIEAADAPLR